MRRFAVVLVAVLVAGVLTPAAASARPPDQPQSTVSNYPSSISVQVPAGGSGTVASPTLPPKARSIKVEIETEVGATIARLKAALAAMDNRQRLLTCVAIGNVKLDERFNPSQFDESAYLSIAAMRLCFALVAELTAPPTTSAVAVLDSACPAPGIFKATADITQSSTGYKATAQPGTPHTAKRAPVKVRCRMTSNMMTLKIKTRSRAKTLRKVLGPRVTIGLANPGTESGTATVTYLPPK